jgi:hypothetical protein
MSAIDSKDVGEILIRFARPLTIALVLAIPAKHWGMLRGFAMFAVPAIFLISAPGLREWIAKSCAPAVSLFDQYSPWSYAALAFGVIAMFIGWASRSPRTR